MKLRVKTIIIITKKNDHTLVGMARQVTDFLLYHSASKKDPYTMSPLFLPKNGWLIISYVDQDFDTSPAFDYQGLLQQNPTYSRRVKFWTPELCLRQPHLFDFVITVPPLPSPEVVMLIVVGRRRHRPLCFLAFPTCRPPRRILLSW